MKTDAAEALDKIAPPTGDYQFAADWYRAHGYPPPGWSYVPVSEFDEEALTTETLFDTKNPNWPLYCTLSKGGKRDADGRAYFMIRNDLLRRFKL